MYNEDIGMEFGTEKCDPLIMKIGKKNKEGIELPNKESERSEKFKITSIREYSKRTPKSSGNKTY